MVVTVQQACVSLQSTHREKKCVCVRGGGGVRERGERERGIFKGSF